MNLSGYTFTFYFTLADCSDVRGHRIGDKYAVAPGCYSTYCWNVNGESHNLYNYVQILTQFTIYRSGNRGVMSDWLCLQSDDGDVRLLFRRSSLFGGKIWYRISLKNCYVRVCFFMKYQLANRKQFLPL